MLVLLSNPEIPIGSSGGKCADLDLREWRYLDVRKWFYLDTLLNIKLNELDPFLQAVK